MARLVLSGVVANLGGGTLFGWSLVAEPAGRDLGAPASTATTVFATAIAVFTLALLGVRRGLHAAGPRRLLAAAAVASFAGLGLTATAQHPAALLCGTGVAFGAASGLAYGVAVALAAQVPLPRRGAATGAVVAAYAASPVVLGLAAPHLLPLVGWRVCAAGLAVAVAVLLAGAAALAPTGPAAGGGRSAVEERVDPRAVVPLWLVFAGGATPGLFVFASAAALAAGRGLGPAAGGAAVAALAAGNLGGRLVAGWGSDRVGRRPALAVALAVAAASLVGLSGPASAWLVLPAFGGTGLAYGAVSALVPAATADCVGARAFPRAYGRVFTAWGAAGLVAPVVGGLLTGGGGQRAGLVLLLAVPLVPAAVALALLPLPRHPG